MALKRFGWRISHSNAMNAGIVISPDGEQFWLFGTPEQPNIGMYATVRVWYYLDDCDEAPTKADIENFIAMQMLHYSNLKVERKCQ